MGVKDKIPEDDKSTLLNAINETTSWLDANQAAERRSSRRSKRPLKALPCRSFRRWPVLEAWEACPEEWEAWVECQEGCLTWVAWVALLLRTTPLVDPPLRKSIKRESNM